MDRKLGIIAGGGDLPGQLIKACVDDGRPYFVVALDGQADHPLIEQAPHVRLRVGAAKAARDALKEAGVEDLVFAGWVRRPSLREIRPDAHAAKVMLRASLRGLGDDGLLGAIVKEFEAQGFNVVGADAILTDILAPVGAIGRHRPDEQARKDIERGVAVARGLGSFDVGQSVVVQQGIVLGVEAIEGTDALIRRCGELRRDGPGGVLVKLVKPGQDRRIDLPTVGPNTVKLSSGSGLRGVAVEAGGTIMLQREDMVAAADAADLFLLGVAGD